VLTTSRKTGKCAFTTEHRDMIELAETRAEQQRLALLDDRDRIAEDLQDDVIRQLFGAGLALQGIASAATPGPTRQGIQHTIGDLGRAIARIRSNVFDLRSVSAGNSA
jgi:signal transduction histidine kinase